MLECLRAVGEPEGEEKTHIRHFLTSLDHEQDKRIGRAVRGHWGIENRNHYKRDTSLWQEDAHRHRRINIAQNLALTRNALLAVMPFAEGVPLSSCFEVYQRHPAKALQLILHALSATVQNRISRLFKTGQFVRG